MKTADEIYLKWYAEWRQGEHPTLTEREIIIKAMEEYAKQEVEDALLMMHIVRFAEKTNDY